MCGRYAASASAQDLVEAFDVESDETGGDLVPDYNVAPTRQAPVVLERLARDNPQAPPVRQLRQLSWGLVPSWAKDPTIGARMINARAETLLDKPAFRRAALTRRCLAPADGWYEWQAVPDPAGPDPAGPGAARKRPFFTHLADGGRLAFAGIFEFWRDPRRADDDPLAWRATYAIITAQAEPGLERLHDRMPVALAPDRWDAWLNPRQDSPEQVLGLLAPMAPGRFASYPVSSRVGNVASTGRTLLDPVE